MGMITGDNRLRRMPPRAFAKTKIHSQTHAAANLYSSGTNLMSNKYSFNKKCQYMACLDEVDGKPTREHWDGSKQDEYRSFWQYLQ